MCVRVFVYYRLFVQFVYKAWWPIARKALSSWNSTCVALRVMPSLVFMFLLILLKLDVQEKKETTLTVPGLRREKPNSTMSDLCRLHVFPIIDGINHFTEAGCLLKIAWWCPGILYV